MNSKVLSTVKAHKMLGEGDKVIVALSGGADSVSLLNVLSELSSQLGITLSAAHVNHKLRGAESDRDESFVRSLCRSKGVELFVKCVDVGALAKIRGESFETVGRDVRYEFFRELSKKHKALIATAHTADDALETALMNLSRGTTLSGLCSIPYKRDTIIRPLLDVTKAEIDAYVSENRLEYVFDSTNSDENICNRNKIRHRVVPVLKEVNSGTEENFIRLRQSLTQVEDFLTQEAQRLLDSAKESYGFSAERLLNAHPALLSYALRLILISNGAGFENRHIELIVSCLKNGGAVDLQKGCSAVVKQGILRISKEKSDFGGELPFAVNSEAAVGDRVCSIRLVSAEEIVYKKLSTFCIGCDKISLGATLRTRRQGDKFSLAERGITKDLRKLQNELKIPAEQRKHLLLLESGGEILWAEGVGVSAYGRYTGGDGVIIEIREDKGNA